MYHDFQRSQEREAERRKDRQPVRKVLFPAFCGIVVGTVLLVLVWAAYLLFLK